MRALWELIRPPRGRSIRRLLSFLSLGLAYVYFVNAPPVFQTGLNTAYNAQATILPLFHLGILFLFFSFLLLFSVNWRHTFLGRLIAIFTFAFYVLFAYTFLPNGPTAFVSYAIAAYAALGEASFVHDEDE